MIVATDTESGLLLAATDKLDRDVIHGSLAIHP